MKEKICKRCNLSQPIENFPLWNRKNGNPYRASHCKPCWNEKNKDIRKSGSRKEYEKKYQAERRKSNPEHYRKILFKSKNNMEWDSYLQEIERRNNRCDICGQIPTAKKPNHLLKIDHDHSCCNEKNKKRCGKCNRGLLCHLCNVSLGGFKDNIEFLKNAIAYLEKYNNV